MCGLLGYWMREPDDRTVVATAVLAAFMQERGDHSWGVYHDGSITRGMGSITEGIDVQKIKGVRVLMGHTRFASVGARTLKNAHPFVCGKTIGCHNGGVSNHEELNKKYTRDFECDSPHIFAHIDAGLPLSELQGHGAFTWITEGQPDSISMVRSTSGSLEIAVLREGEAYNSKKIGIMWASTKGPLEKAVHVAGFHASVQWMKAEARHFVDPADEKDLLFYAKSDKEKWEFGPYVSKVTSVTKWEPSEWQRPPFRGRATEVPIETRATKREKKEQRKALHEGRLAIVYRGGETLRVGVCYACKKSSRLWWNPRLEEFICSSCDARAPIVNEPVDETNDALRALWGGMGGD